MRSNDQIFIYDTEQINGISAVGLDAKMTKQDVERLRAGINGLALARVVSPRMSYKIIQALNALAKPANL